MVNAFTRHSPTFKQTYVFYRKLLQIKTDIRNILLLQINDKYEAVKRKPVVGYDSRRAWACNFFK